MTKKLKQVIEFAKAAHGNQTRRDGKTPYWHHLESTYNKVKGLEDDEINQIAWLHDVLEDTSKTLKDLLDFGISESVCDSVLRLTKPRYKVEYSEYLLNLKQDNNARIVKIADMLSNLLDDPTEKQIEKYTFGIMYLSSSIR
jgi:(p)ppGpp synthase/HD superfamily hydrolase